MRPGELLLALVLTCAAPASAEPQSSDAPLAVPVLTPAEGKTPTVTRPPAPRSARLLAEGLTAAGFGVVVPLGAYVGLTSLGSFVGFFAGFLTGTVFGVVLAPIAIIIAGRIMGAGEGVGRAVVGALVGLAAGLLIGLPLITLPSMAYLLGLGLLWALPSVGTIIGFEWGRPVDEAQRGLVVVRF